VVAQKAAWAEAFNRNARDKQVAAQEAAAEANGDAEPNISDTRYSRRSTDEAIEKESTWYAEGSQTMRRMLARPEWLPDRPEGFKELKKVYPFIQYYSEFHQDLIYDNPGT
jgi:hypothetical protein